MRTSASVGRTRPATGRARWRSGRESSHSWTASGTFAVLGVQCYLSCMDAKTPQTEIAPTPEETPEEREKLLSALRPKARELIEEIMADYPTLTAAEAI